MKRTRMESGSALAFLAWAAVFGGCSPETIRRGGMSGTGGMTTPAQGGGTAGPAGTGSGAPNSNPAPVDSCIRALDSPPFLPRSFVSNCSGCHSGFGPSANAQVPDLFQYKGTAEAFVGQVRAGGKLMPPFDASAISTADLSSIFGYFRAAKPGEVSSCPSGNDSKTVDACTGTSITFEPLFAPTEPQPQPIFWTDAQGVLHTRAAGRVRGRHELEEEFSIFHPQYFEDRSFVFLIDDSVISGGGSVTVTYLPEANAAAAPPTNLRFWKVYGDGNVFHANVGMMPADPKHWTWEITRNSRENRELRPGDLLELEFGVFIDKAGLTTLGTRTAYYSDTFRYRVGSGGLTPFNADMSMNVPGVNRLGPETPGHSGGTTTIPFVKEHQDLYYSQMALNIQGETIRDFLQGRRLFHTDFLTGKHVEAGNVLSPAQTAAHAGLAGPLFNQVTCEGCHARDGGGLPPEAGKPMDSMVLKIFGPGLDAHGANTADPSYGKQLQDKAAAGAAAEGQATVAWAVLSGAFEDGTPFSLRKPTVSFLGLSAGPIQRFSARVARSLIGLGLLEAMSETEILTHADLGDCNKDGVSGRPNLVWDPEDGKVHVGRFGWKAAKASVRHQAAEAAMLDLGVTSSVFPEHDCGSAQTSCTGKDGKRDLTSEDLDRLVTYLRLLAVPARRDMDRADVQRGEILFGQIGCANCHAPTQRTAATHPFAELRNQIIHPYTDLLLHDMGPDLADSSERDLLAEPSEWRTPPLWGIGLCDTVSGGSGSAEFPSRGPCRYLHDGRAQSLIEAVLWHGGEAQAMRERVVALPATDRTALVAFLQSL